MYRATCEVENCNWTGNWRSVWNKWETLLEEVEEDYLQHMLVTHGNHGQTANE